VKPQSIRSVLLDDPVHGHVLYHRDERNWRLAMAYVDFTLACLLICCIDLYGIKGAAPPRRPALPAHGRGPPRSGAGAPARTPTARRPGGISVEMGTGCERSAINSPPSRRPHG